MKVQSPERKARGSARIGPLSWVVLWAMYSLLVLGYFGAVSARSGWYCIAS